jgi:hypothetical protein
MKERTEHSLVTTSHKFKREGQLIPADSQGTIIHVYKGKNAYAVEFTDLPNNPIVTMYESDMTPNEEAL